MVICPVCGMGYVEGLPEDEKAHRAYHDPIANGVSGAPVKSDKVIWNGLGDRITVVTGNSRLPQRIRAQKVGKVANAEMHHTGGIYCATEWPDDRDIHLFLYYVRNRIVGLAIFERRRHLWLGTWTNKVGYQTKELEECPGIWSLGILWVHKKHRRRGIARRLFEEGIAHLGVDRRSVGFYEPFSTDGEAFVRSLCPLEFLIAK